MSRSRTVYVTQIPHRRDENQDKFVPAIDINPAAEHGDIKVMLSHREHLFATSDVIKQLREHLTNYDYDAGDSVVLVGDLGVMAAASALLGNMFGRFILLKWDRNMGRYLPIHIKVV